MGREKWTGTIEKQNAEQNFLDGESGMLLLSPVSKKVPAMIDPPAKISPAPLHQRNSSANTLGAFPAMELLCA